MRSCALMWRGYGTYFYLICVCPNHLCKMSCLYILVNFGWILIRANEIWWKIFVFFKPHFYHFSKSEDTGQNSNSRHLMSKVRL